MNNQQVTVVDDAESLDSLEALEVEDLEEGIAFHAFRFSSS
ncbi:hypothetical protein ACIOEX_19135 [Streptomyces sp. NPDC087850]